MFLVTPLCFVFVIVFFFSFFPDLLKIYFGLPPWWQAETQFGFHARTTGVSLYSQHLSQNRTLLLKYDSSGHLKGCSFGGEGVADFLIFLPLKQLPFSRDGLFGKASPLSLPCFTAGFVLYLTLRKGSVVFVVFNQLHWLGTRWTGKSRKNKGRCIYRTAVPWQWAQLQLQAQLRSAAPIQQEQCAWNPLLSMTPPLLKVTVVYHVPQHRSTSAAVLI